MLEQFLIKILGENLGIFFGGAFVLFSFAIAGFITVICVINYFDK